MSTDAKHPELRNAGRLKMPFIPSVRNFRRQSYSGIENKNECVLTSDICTGLFKS